MPWLALQNKGGGRELAHFALSPRRPLPRGRLLEVHYTCLPMTVVK